MSTVNQIYSLINDVSKQAFGEKAITVADTSTLVSLGDSVLSSEQNTDLFTNTLVDRIGRTVFSVRRYMARDDGMVREPFEFGCIVQKIYVDLPEAKENKSWEIGKDGYKPEFAPVIKPSVKQKFFNKISTWEIDVTIPDFMLRTAFTNATQMASFIDAIFMSLENMMTLALENNANMTRASFIARKIKDAKPCGAINLLKEYNDLTGAALTINNALRNSEFLKWSAKEINLWVNRMSRMSTLFNDEGYKRHTPKSDIVVNVLQDFSSATTAFMESDTYHNELVKLPRYESVPYWQGSGTKYSFTDTSAIDVRLDAETEVKKSGIVAVIYDYMAMGVTLTEKRSATQRNNKDEYTNYYNKANFGYFNDMSENGIVFYLEETA